MLYRISNNDLSVGINDLGAEIKSVVYRGEERAWQNENGAWSGTSPILFPVCGKTLVNIAGKDMKMPFHGFARNSVFSCDKIGFDEATFVLHASEQTFAVYPFDFSLKVTYKVQNDTITITNEIKNEGDTPMPFALGRHDSFLLKKPVGNYKLCFPCEEEFMSQKATDEGLINLYFDFGKGKEFILPEDYLTNGETVIFGGINSDQVTLKTLDNRPIARLSFGETGNLLVWRPDGAQMVCIEPWSALLDRVDESDDDFFGKARFSVVGAGETKTMKFEIKYY